MPAATPPPCLDRATRTLPVGTLAYESEKQGGTMAFLRGTCFFVAAEFCDPFSMISGAMLVPFGLNFGTFFGPGAALGCLLGTLGPQGCPRGARGEFNDES